MPHPEIIGAYCPLTLKVPTNRLFEVHDALVLALDATHGTNVPYRNVAESRSYLRDALAKLNCHLPALIGPKLPLKPSIN